LQRKQMPFARFAALSRMTVNKIPFLRLAPLRPQRGLCTAAFSLSPRLTIRLAAPFRLEWSPVEETKMPYVDGFVLAVPKDNIEAYKDMARTAGDVWKEHGALSFVECIGDDVPYGELTSFPRAVQAKDDEVVVFSWITYPSREARDQINAKVMADPRLSRDKWTMPFDGKRMIYGGFKSFLEL